MKIEFKETNRSNINIDPVPVVVERSKEIDLDKVYKTVIGIGIILMILFSVVTSISYWSSTENGSVTVNLVAEPGATDPAFLGYEFTPELKEAIVEGSIDLYGIQVEKMGNDINIIGDNADKIYIVDAVYKQHTAEYINTHFTSGFNPEPGYWEYTIGLKGKGA